MNIVGIVALSSFAGALAVGILGYLKAKNSEAEPFDIAKFLPTVLRACIAAGTVAASYPLWEGMAFWPAVIGGFMAGAGFDVTVHEIAGTIRKKA